MLPTEVCYELAERLPNASLSIYDGAGHGAISREQSRLFIRHSLLFSRLIR